MTLRHMFDENMKGDSKLLYNTIQYNTI